MSEYLVELTGALVKQLKATLVAFFIGLTRG